jgi:hypothetical protein
LAFFTFDNLAFFIFWNLATLRVPPLLNKHAIISKLN